MLTEIDGITTDADTLTSWLDAVPLASPSTTSELDVLTAGHGPFGFRVTEVGCSAPVIHVDTERSLPVRHRLIRGEMGAGSRRFEIVLPIAQIPSGRMVHFLQSDSPADSCAVGSGDVVCTSSEATGATAPFEPSDPLRMYRIDAEIARFAKWMAEVTYGVAPRWSYLVGSHAEGRRVLACLSNRPDVWDGGVAGACGVSPTPYWSAMAATVTVLAEGLDSVVGDGDLRGSDDSLKGDWHAKTGGLSQGQRRALGDLLSMGYPKRALHRLRRAREFEGAATQIGPSFDDYHRRVPEWRPRTVHSHFGPVESVFGRFRSLGRPVPALRHSQGVALDSVDPFAAKLVMVGCVDDELTWPVMTVLLDERLRERLGPDTSGQYRLFWTTADRLGESLTTALQAVSGWVERRDAPGPDTPYTLNHDNDIELGSCPSTSTPRRGVTR